MENRGIFDNKVRKLVFYVKILRIYFDIIYVKVDNLEVFFRKFISLIFMFRFVYEFYGYV